MLLHCFYLFFTIISPIKSAVLNMEKLRDGHLVQIKSFANLENTNFMVRNGSYFIYCPSGSLLLHTFDDGRIICTQKSDLISLLEKSGSKLDSSIPEEPSTGFKDCGKRSGQRDTTLSFSNGAVISAQQVNSKLHSTIKAIHLRDIAKCLGEA